MRTLSEGEILEELAERTRELVDSAVWLRIAGSGNWLAEVPSDEELMWAQGETVEAARKALQEKVYRILKRRAQVVLAQQEGEC